MDQRSPVKIQVRGLSKVFGKHPQKAIELRNQGMKRPEILEKTGQTLGLSNISFDVYEGRAASYHGPVRIWQINADPLSQPSY